MEQEKQVASSTLPTGSPAGTAVIFRGAALCQAMELQSGSAPTVNFTITTHAVRAQIKLFGLTGDPALLPRLTTTGEKPHGTHCGISRTGTTRTFWRRSSSRFAKAPVSPTAETGALLNELRRR